MRNADAVGLELLGARKARHRQFGLGQRQRRQIGIGAHVGDDAGNDRGLAGLVLADRGVLCDHMRHLVAQNRRQFRSVAGERDQAAGDVKLAGRQREGIDRAGIEDRHLVGLVGPVGSRHQPVDRLGDQGLELRIVIGAAIGGEDAFVLALGGGRLRHRVVGLDRTGRWRDGLQLEPVHVAAGGEQQACRHKDRRSPKAAAHPLLAPSRNTSHFGYSFPFGGLIPAN